MITIDFEKRGNTGLCEYLVESLEREILEGRIIAGEKLPSKRSLAAHLGISVITVQNAYNRLIEEGYIYSIEKKGFFTTEIVPVKESGTKNRATDVSGTAKGNEDARPVQEFFADFQSNATPSEKFPFNIWAKVSRLVLNSGDETLLNRQDIFGAEILRKAIAKYLFEFRNMDISYEQILIGAGTESLYSMLVQYLGRNRRYALENPGYGKVASIFELEGAKCTAVPIDSEGMNPNLFADADIVHLSPSHHFPTGIVTPIRRRTQILNWAGEKPGRIIIEDDYDSEFRFNGKPLPTLQSKDRIGSVIYINTFSKTLAPSFRISYMVLPMNLVKDFHSKFNRSSCQVNAFEQYTLAEFINQGFYSKHIIRMKNYYRTLRNELISSLQRSGLNSIATIHEEEAGLHFLLTIRTSSDAKELEQRLKKQNIRLPLLRDYFHKQGGSYRDLKKRSRAEDITFVVNYSGIRKDRIPETVKRMERAFAESGRP